ncbi:MAG: RNA methyltransferase [Paracoccus sp. (in: a-proteobacteria)]|uniref:RNA methyltransferase n=1 Tax=Paracoccus sp. TaxID=267 RepID=UPI0026DFE860|nr:RNA methyltransferase [Paracoccus sp. (in: a-proteobacteria)]MDO5632689.1 RNA methyltransferase [Paracoccus sp. (in: a-proteobacteria)]
MTAPIIILVRPQMGENIGAAARAMLNFGLTEMRLVAPRDGWPNPRAVAMASGAAGQVLDRARVYPTLAEAMEGVDLAFATTARGRELTKPVHTPETAMAQVRTYAGQAAVIFGPERAGLENDDIARANAIITVPVNPGFASLNLAQAVLLTGYEYSRGLLPDQPAPPGRRPTGEAPADRLEIERLADHFEERLDHAGFFFPPEKAPTMKLTMRNLWSRMPLTQGDVRALHGALRQLVRRKE